MNAQLVAMDDGVRLHVEVAGPDDAPVILFCHSVGCDASQWDTPFTSLMRDYRVIRYDTRGHGKSDAPIGDYAVERLAKDALAVLDWAGAEQASVCGLSLGGTTAIWLALHASARLRGIVLANSSARLGTPQGWQSRMDVARADGMEALADFSMTRFFSAPFREKHPEVVLRYRRTFAATDPGGFAGCCAVLRDCDFHGQLHIVEVPTLVIAGDFDEPTPPSDSWALVSGIRGSTYLTLPSGHLSVVENGPSFSRTLAEWLLSTKVRYAPR